MRRWEPAGNDASSSPDNVPPVVATVRVLWATIGAPPPPMRAAAIATVAAATWHPFVLRADLAVGPFVGPNAAVLGRIRRVAGRLRLV